MSNAIDIGDLVRASGAFKSEPSGTSIDPTTVTLTVKDPTNTVVTYTYGIDPVVKDSVGNYHFDINITTSGNWYYRWAGSGAVGQSAEESGFVVRASLVA